MPLCEAASLRSTKKRSAICLFLATAFIAPVLAQVRSEVLLSGDWEYQKVPDLSYPPPPGGWQPTTVPGYLSGTNYERAWFRRQLGVPRIAQGKRLKLRFLGVKYNSVVYVNGQKVGGHFGGHEMFEVDITSAAKAGRRNEILVGVHDWTGLFNRRMDLEGDWNRLRSAPTDAILAPIGGIYGSYGIWDDVYLLALPEVHIAQVFVKPSVRQGTLTVDLELHNEGAEFAQLTVTSHVLDGDALVLELPQRQVRSQAATTSHVTTSAPAEGLEFWWPHSPKLYTLRLTLTQAGKVVDTLDTRFGYRELWAEGQWFVLNGQRVILRASSWWPPRTAETREQVAETIQALKDGNNICFRTHTQPWRHLWYEVADELGLLMIPEGAVWNDDGVYRIEDPVFWDNYADHLQRMVRQHRNHPSIVIWSLENEFYGSRLNDDSPAKADLVRMGRLLKQWDPTRLITYESDLDPGRVADVIGLHYPHEYPDYQLYPNTCYWMDQPKTMQGRAFTEGREMWKWNRAKPLYIGEFLWVPSSDPSWHTIFFGDDAYLDYRDYRNRAKAESWKMQIEAYRWYRVSGICPWTEGEGGPLNEEENVLYAAQKWAFQPIAAYCREYDARFYGGQTIERTLAVYNDVPRASDLSLEWQLRQGGRPIQSGSRRLVLEAAARQAVKLALKIPQVDERTELALYMAIFDGRQREPAFEEAKTYWAFPRQNLPSLPETRVALYDPPGATAQALKAAGVQFERLKSLDGPLSADLLIIGARSLKKTSRGIPLIGVQDSAQFAVADFVDRGGRLLVLEQDEYPEGLLPVSQTNHAATMAFPQVANHPILADVRPDDLKWWRGDHLVSENDLARPVAGGCRPIVVSGGREGLAFCPQLELPRGRGTLIHTPLKRLRKLDQEPAARLILANCLRYLASFRPTVLPTHVLADDAFCAVLDSLGLEYGRVGTPAARNPSTSAMGLARARAPLRALVIHQGPVQPLLQLRPGLDLVLENGGVLLLHRLSPEDLAALGDLIGSDLRLTRSASPIVKQQADDPILDLVT
ncbi:MAG: glycoside hydrolase family 2 protein, partial [Armatimonadota bacterium]